MTVEKGNKPHNAALKCLWKSQNITCFCFIILAAQRLLTILTQNYRFTQWHFDIEGPVLATISKVVSLSTFPKNFMIFLFLANQQTNTRCLKHNLIGAVQTINNILQKIFLDPECDQQITFPSPYLF